MEDAIELTKVAVHNLKNVSLSIPKNKLVVFTGVSGSGKSSLAFDTIYAEGQRRYVESLSPFARRQMGEMEKPDAEKISGITPTISIEQKTAGKNPRSTVGTMTEVYDYMRVLFARVGTPHCPVSGEAVSLQSKERIIRTVQALPVESKLIILAPYARDKKAEFKEDFQELLKKGYIRVRVDGKIVNLNDDLQLDGSVSHSVDIVIDRLSVYEENASRIAEAITQALEIANGECIALIEEEERYFSMHSFSPASGLSYSSLEPHDFSFNSPSGMCPRCQGLGEVREFDRQRIIDPDKSIADDCCIIASSYETVRFGNIYRNLARLYNFSVRTAWKKLPEEAKKVFLYGTEKKWTRMTFVHPQTGKRWTDHIMWRGVLEEAHKRYADAKSERYKKRIERWMTSQTCSECNGGRLKPYPLFATIGGQSIAALTEMTIGDLLLFFSKLELRDEELLIGNELLREIKERLRFLQEVGLHYLTLNRTAPTLSGGEAQRVRLASQIGCGLVGITYILDEPSIGLHPRDNDRLIRTLRQLCDIGNSVLVVEHDEETILSADQVIDIGPGPGSRGGEVVFQGEISELLDCKKSLTADYLIGRKSITVPKNRRKKKKQALVIKGAAHHNLKNLTVKIPLGLFTAVTGVSGSGKSSLVSEILYPALSNALHLGDHIVGAHKEILGIDHIDKVIAIDQSPIGRNPRSNPATYIKLFDEIRDLFSSLPEAKAKGFSPGRFSFNVKNGSCPQCRGMGMIKIDMDFMEDAFVACSLCKGKRFDQETLSVAYKGKSIYDVLEMEVAEALSFFENLPRIKQKLATLKQVGMEYIKLGQFSTTLSGGEAQRVKLAKELTRPSTGKTLYILDEPTTGLHFHDIKHLLEVLHHLVDQGNTVLVIEHNMDVIKTADWIIDLGPEGGAYGGELVGEGTPEEIAKKITPTAKAIAHAQAQTALQIRKMARCKKTNTQAAAITSITVEMAEQNNLKAINATLPRNALTVCTGPSGSGKTSLAFETIYAEGQRRYIESLSPYARQFVKQMQKPKAARVEGLSPAIAIEQKAHAGNPRSTVGTLTEIYDYLRILFARLGTPHCPETGEVIESISKEFVAKTALGYPQGEKIQVLAPIEVKRGDEFSHVVSRLQKQGYLRLRLNSCEYTVDEQIPYDRKRKNLLYLVVDRLKVDPSIEMRLLEAIETAAKEGGDRIVIAREEEDVLFNLAFAVKSTGLSYPPITPHTFAFNVAEGMCPSCYGLGVIYGTNFLDDLSRYPIDRILRMLFGRFYTHAVKKQAAEALARGGIDLFLPIKKLNMNQRRYFLKGVEEPLEAGLHWKGLDEAFEKLAKSGRSLLKDAVLPLLDQLNCPVCDGARINALARHVTIKEKAIQDVVAMPIKQALAFIESIERKADKVLEEVFRQLKSRLNFLVDIGLHYLSLNRKAPTLSGGEAQRIRLAAQLGSRLTGVLYVLDEPTIGLHPRDNNRLIRTIRQLGDLGNTLIMVEHDLEMVRAADYILDFGPGSGEEGGHIVARGTVEQLMLSNSLTGAYLSGSKTIAAPEKYRTEKNGFLKVLNATANNLKSISASFPIGCLSCVTGVSGSGKSSLVQEMIAPAVRKGLHKNDTVTLSSGKVLGIAHFERLITIDQNPVGHTSRSDVATYVDVLTRLRSFFSSLPEAKMRGLLPKHFSYNHKSGMCTRCLGLGYRRVQMHFLPTVNVPCDQCEGLRLNPLSLQVSYKGKNLGEYLQHTILEARQVFENHPRIIRILDTLINVGLGYLRLGQEVQTLSGGEAQRIKLSRELSKRSYGKTLYLLDEPTTGLHNDDIVKLIKVLHTLVDKGNTMIVIEHSCDFIKNCDHIIDLGPEAGDEGGEVIFSGSVECLKECLESYTGQFLSLVG